MQPLEGTKYSIVRELGAGGMGVVYQVVKPPNIQGVLKLMSSELTQHEDLLVRFFDEVRILAQLDHPNIVRVFDYDALPDGTPFYVMELLNGRTVRDVLQAVGRVPPRVAYEITRQLLEALQCAHTHEIPVVHRDIKPENIFLHAPKHGDPAVKLIDFGVSSVADRKHDDSFVGTWGYAAPEQIRGEKPTAATDLYAVGLVLYEMLAGRGAFDHHPDWKMLSIAQLEEVPAPVSTFAPWVPPSIVALIASALEKDPRRRPRDAYAFAEQLFELEWANDGKETRDPTEHGRSAPLSRMLTSVENARVTPAYGSRAGSDDAPIAAVPAAAVQHRPTARGIGDPGPGVVIRPGSNPSLGDDVKGPTVAVGSLPPPPPSSRSSLAPRPSESQVVRRTSLGFLALAAVLMLAGLAIAITIVLRSPSTPPVTAHVVDPPVTPASSTAPPPSPSPVVPPPEAASTPAPPVRSARPVRSKASADAPGRTDYAREL